MKRIALVLAAALLGTGCIVVDDDDPVRVPVGTLDAAWWFVRTKADTTTVSYTCADAGIDSVTIAYSRGGSANFPCRTGAFEGAVHTAAPVGSQTVTLTAFRGSAALYQSSFNVTIAQDATLRLDADLWGIPDDLDIYANFVEWNGAPGWASCGTAVVTTLTWSLVDWFGTVVDQGSAPCTNPAGVSYRGAQALDRDQYTIRMQGFPSGGPPETFDSATTAVTPTCDGQAFDHYGPSLDPFAWDVLLYWVDDNLTFCD